VSDTPLFDRLAADRLSTHGLPLPPEPPTTYLRPQTTWRGDLIRDPLTQEMPTVTQPEHVQTSHPQRKLGRLPEHPEHLRPRLHLGQFLRGDYKLSVPDVVDYSTKVASWPMAANDRLGDCTAADAAHGVQVWTTWGQGQTITPSDEAVVKFYSASTGYDPADPATDQGGNLQEVCEAFRTIGIAGRTIEAFFRVNSDDFDELRSALYLFGAVSIGMAFPEFAMDQFNHDQPWDYVPGRTRVKIEGGHDVLLVGATKGGNLKVVTWGKVQEVTPRFWTRFMGSRAHGEAWARVEQDWVASSGIAPGNALDVAALNQAFMSLTGQPGPFTQPETPQPVDPEPDPVAYDLSRELLDAATSLEDTAKRLRQLLSGA